METVDQLKEEFANAPLWRRLIIGLAIGLALSACTRNAEFTCYGFCSKATSTEIKEGS